IPATNSCPSQELADSIRAWTRECDLEHHDCSHQVRMLHGTSSTKAPTRLLDVRPSEDLVMIRLCESAELASDLEYVTLSHCWGLQLPARLLKDNYPDMKSSIAIAMLPQTFRDAIHFTRLVGIRYLWIDALCIIQDSHDDWLHESLLMARTYSFAVLNIASTSASDGRGGLFRDRNLLLATPCVIEATWSGHQPGRFVCVDESSFPREVEAGPLNSRAWVFQERILAPRTVHFARDQLWWECRQSTACEAYPKGVPGPSLAADLPLVRGLTSLDYFSAEHDYIGANESWLGLLGAYTQTQITKDSDRLIALAGIATVFYHQMKWAERDYYAGLWAHDLAVDLLWRVREEGSRTQKGFVAPSWSWASVN
ncbi:hypothetical protein CERZMDRAFT_12598, partial [Cercospora zeae-maydis SCOH1-5]